MTRRRQSLILLVLLAGAAGLGFLRLPRWSSDFLAGRLSAFFDRPVSVKQVRFHLLPLHIEVLDLRVGGPTPEAPPFLTLPRATVVPSIASLWGSNLVLARLRLEGLKVSIHAFAGRGDDIPKLGTAASRGRGIRVRRLVIESGELSLNHARVPLELELPDFEGRLAQRRGGVLAGRVAFGPGSLRFGTAPPLPIATEMDLSLEGSVLTVESAHARTELTDLSYEGAIRLDAGPQGRFTLQGPVDLDTLDRHVMRTGFGIRGDAHWQGTLSIDGSRLGVAGRMEGTAGAFGGVPVSHFAGQVAWDGDGVRLRQLDLATLEGSGTVNLDLPPGDGVARLDAEFRDLDAERALQAIFHIGSPAVGAAATGQVAISWPRGRIRQLSGTLAADLVTREDGRTPFSGRFEWRAERGVQWIDKADLWTPATRARLQGRIEIDNRTDITVDGESTDLAASDDLGARLRRALGTPEAVAIGVTGAGAFRGQWTGTLSYPVFEGRFTGRDVGYLGVVWGRADWAGLANPSEVQSHSLVLRREGGELWLDGRNETGNLGERDVVDVRVRFKNWPASDFIKAFDWKLDFVGLLSGEAAVKGRRSEPFGPSHVTATEGRYYGVAYSDLDLTAELKGHLTEVSAARARVSGGSVSFSGTLTDDDVYDGKVQATGVDVGGILPAVAADIGWGGKLDAEVALQGRLEAPRVTARLKSARLFLGDEGLGALDATFTGDGDGQIRVDARCLSPRVDLALTGNVGASRPYTSELRFVARETSLDPFLRAVVPGLPAVVGIVASGAMEARGPLEQPRELRLDAALSSLEVRFAEYPIRNRDDLRVTVAEGQLLLRDVRMAGDGTDLVVSGSAPLFEDDTPARIRVQGAADLRTLSAVTPRLRGRGAARLGMEVSGTRLTPRVQGTLDLDGAGLRLRGFPHGIEGLRGSVDFTQAAAHFSGVTGTVGSGGVELEGQASYAEGHLTSFDVHGIGRSMTLRYPEGLRSVIDADLRLFGDAARQWATGSVDVRQATWTKRYDIASELLAASGPAWEATSLGEGVRYDIKVRAPGTLKIDNNLAALQARADLVLQGSYDAPIILGRAEIDRGRVYFQGNTYQIRRGSIDFADPRKIDPLFDIEAETRIRTYRVTLKMNGTLERIYPTLSSDPPLTAVQILNLLAGADESIVTSLTQASADQARLAATGAATLAAGRLSEEVGLERRAERLGLSRFSIDPSVVRGGVTNTTARLTVGKRITPDLNVLYSQDLRGTEERLLSVEYTLSDRLSILLTRAELEGFGVDVRVRHAK